MRDFKNPFIYGGRVSGDAFCNRESEIRELLEAIRGRQHVIIYSQRRFGKTSLVWKILEETQKEGIIPVYADLYPISTLGEFIEEYAKAIARTLSMHEKAKRLMRELFSRLHLSMGIDTAGNPQWSVGFDRSRESETFDEVVSSMENYLKRKGKYGVVVFDEFQQIVDCAVLSRPMSVFLICLWAARGTSFSTSSPTLTALFIDLGRSFLWKRSTSTTSKDLSRRDTMEQEWILTKKP